MDNRALLSSAAIDIEQTLSTDLEGSLLLAAVTAAYIKAGFPPTRACDRARWLVQRSTRSAYPIHADLARRDQGMVRMGYGLYE